MLPLPHRCPGTRCHLCPSCASRAGGEAEEPGAGGERGGVRGRRPRRHACGEDPGGGTGR